MSLYNTSLNFLGRTWVHLAEGNSSAQFAAEYDVM